MAKRRIYDAELHAQFVTFFCYREWCWSSARYYEQNKSVGVPLGWVF